MTKELKFMVAEFLQPENKNIQDESLVSKVGICGVVLFPKPDTPGKGLFGDPSLVSRIEARPKPMNSDIREQKQIS